MKQQQQQKQQKQSKESPIPPKERSESTRQWPNYREFFKDFDENLRKHFEEHAKTLSQQFGSANSDHLRHMQEHARIHAENMRIHQNIHREHIAGARSGEPADSPSWSNLLDEILEGSDDDPFIQSHIASIKDIGGEEREFARSQSGISLTRQNRLTRRWEKNYPGL